MTDTPEYGTPAPMYGTPPPVNDGYVTDRKTGEQIWDAARQEVRAALDEERRALLERHDEQIALWRWLVEILENPTTKNVKWTPADTERMTEIKKKLGIE
jgi:hypothetical protein